jgi:carboxyl-terminal processing protease
LNQGIKVSELFLDPGQVVVATRGRAPDANRIDRDNDKQIWPGLPIVTLVNGGTASAAEIIAGALQDHDRSLVIGTPTFGKGLVQSLYPFTRDPPTALKLTTARWYTPSGRTIQRKSKSEEDQEAQVAAASIGNARDTTKVDSSLVFHTDMGRTVMGGGGIRPDIFVPADTYTTAERNFMKSLGNKIPTFRDVLSTYALELKAGHLVPSPTFSVTPAMVNEVLSRLRARGALANDSLTVGARGLIAEELGYEATRYAFGRSAEFRRRMGDDSQVKTALRYARQAKNPADLLASAPAEKGPAPK